MKKVVTIAIFTIFATISANAAALVRHQSSVAYLLEAISWVESKHDPEAVGDNGKAVGAYQIHKEYVDDVNRIYGTGFTYEDRKDPGTSKRMVRLYLRYYGARYERITGKKATVDILARIHNGGPNGWKKKATIEYADKVVGVYLWLKSK